MANSLLDLVDSYCVFSADGDHGVTQSFLHSLDEFQALRCGSERQLKTFAAAAASSGLSTSNGIQGMMLLAEQCPDEFFTQHCKAWLDLALASAAAPHALRTRLSKLLRLLFRRSEGCPDQARHISTISSSVIELLTSWAREGGKDGACGARALVAFLSTFPRACGGQSGANAGLEKFVIDSIRPGGPIPRTTLAKCLAILPFLGGGGKEGIQHRQRWTALVADLTDTLAHLVGNLLGKTDTFTSTRRESTTSIRNLLPSCGSSALLPRMLFISHQIETLSACLSEMLLSKCPHAKTLNLTSLFGICQEVLMAPNLGQLLLQDSSLDAQMLASCLPGCMAAVAGLTGDVLLVARENCLLFVPAVINCSVSVLEDIRSIGGGGRLALQDLKCAIFSLLGRLARTLGCSSGLHISAKEVLPLLLANIVPSQPSISLAKAVNGSKARNGVHVQSTTSHRLSSPPKVCAAALEALDDIIRSCGALMSGQVLRELEPIVLSLCLEMQQSSHPPFNNSLCRRQLYQVLLALTTNPSQASPPSLHFASKIFVTGRVTERNVHVAEVCRRACLAIENILHPRAPSFNPEATLGSQDLAEAWKAAMKIHVVVLGGQSLGATAAATSKRNRKEVVSSNGEEFGGKRLKSAEDHVSNKLDEDNEGQGVGEKNMEDNDEDDALAAFMANQKSAHYAERSKRSLKVAESNDDVGVSEDDKKRAMELMYDFSGESIFIPEDVRQASAMRKDEKTADKVDSKVVEEGGKIDLEAMKSLFVAEDSDDE